MSTPAQAVSAQPKKARPSNPNAASFRKSNKGPTARAREKEQCTLALIGTFGFTTTKLVKRLLNIESDGYLLHLQKATGKKAALVQSRSIGRLSEKIWTLTPEGKEAAEMIIGRKVKEVRADKVNTSIAEHDLAAQIAIINIIKFEENKLGKLLELRAEWELKGELNQAAPDLIQETSTADGGVKWLAYESERNQPGEKRMREKMRRLIKLQLVKHCDELHIQWLIKAGEPVRRRYERLWLEVLADMRKEAVDAYPDDPVRAEKMRTMPFPTSSFLEMPK